jgi:hypothetical protein
MKRGLALKSLHQNRAVSWVLARCHFHVKSASLFISPQGECLWPSLLPIFNQFARSCASLLPIFLQCVCVCAPVLHFCLSSFGVRAFVPHSSSYSFRVNASAPHFIFSITNVLSKRVMLIFFSLGHQPLVDQGVLIVEVSRSHSDTPHSVGLLWTNNPPVAKTT